MRGYTQKACPGCGGTSYRKIDSVCRDCLAGLEAGRRLIEWQESQVEYVEVGLHHAPFAIGHARIFGHTPHNALVSEVEKQFIDVWYRHAVAATEPSARENPHHQIRMVESNKTYQYPDMGVEPDSIYGQPTRLMRRELHETLNELDSAFRRLVAMAYYHGVSYGSDLLRRLNDGTITVGEMDKARDDADAYLLQLLEPFKKKEQGPTEHDRHVEAMKR